MSTGGEELCAGRDVAESAVACRRLSPLASRSVERAASARVTLNEEPHRGAAFEVRKDKSSTPVEADRFDRHGLATVMQALRMVTAGLQPARLGLRGA